MTDLKITGRWVGVAILASFVFGMTSNFYLQPMIRTSESALGLFGGAAGQPVLIGSIVLFGLISGLVSIVSAALLCQVSTTQSFAWLSFVYLGISVAAFGMGGNELAIFQLYRDLGLVMLADPSGAIAQLAEPLQSLVTGQRNGIHFPQVLLSGIGIFALYLLLLQSRWVPSWLSIAGLFAAVGQMIGVCTGIFGEEVSVYFLAPLALVHLTAGLWLSFRGFFIGQRGTRL